MNLDSVSQRIQEGRLDTSSVITMQTLREAGLLGKKVSSGVKLLGRVSSESHANVPVCACFASLRISKLQSCKHDWHTIHTCQTYVWQGMLQC